MATMSSAGIGSGLDVASIVSNLMTIARLPIDRIDAQTTKYNTQLTALGKIKSALSNLQTSAKNFSKGLSMKAASGDVEKFTATATSVATAGNYSVDIKHLADYNKAVSVQGYAKDASLSGSLTISLGEFQTDAAEDTENRAGWSFATGQDGDGNDKKVTIDFSAGGTLAELRDAINAQAGGLVKAQIVSGADGDHLSITSVDKGRSNTFKIEGDGDLAAFDYDITQGSTATMREASISWSTEALIDGVAVRSNTNAITGAISGVTINALKTGSSTLAVSRDTDAITSQVEEFVKNYNAVNSTIKLNTGYDAETKTAAALTGDSAVRSIKSQLYNALTTVPDGLAADMPRLSELGISLDRNGQMVLDKTKLTEALDKSQADVSAVLNAYGKQIEKTIDAQLDSTKGTLTIRTNSISGIIKNFGTRKEALETRMTSIEARYNKQFQALDTMMSSMSSTSSYLTQQLSLL